MPCGHISAILIYLWHAINDQMDEFVEKSNKNANIRMNLLNAEIGKKWIKENTIQRVCECNAVKDKRNITIQCESCRRHYHPGCVGYGDGDWFDENKKIKKGFVCPKCKFQFGIN